MDDETDSCSEAECEEWKAKILSIDDPKLLEFIRSLVEARMQIGSAENRLTDESNDPYPTPYAQKPFNPLGIVTEPDDVNEIG